MIPFLTVVKVALHRIANETYKTLAFSGPDDRRGFGLARPRKPPGRDGSSGGFEARSGSETCKTPYYYAGYLYILLFDVES